MSNLVVVAIPEEMDRVWKLSSEQVPHLTLLFLGEADNNPHVQDIVQFVEHATTVSEHGPFYLDIDHRGTLGPDEADVLFFSKRSWNLKWIQNFRAQLLQDPNVKTAYDSTPQYEEWQPHLTMGYPTTPAKEMGENDHPLYSVCFDRIAVWDTDYAGPEFRLEWPEREMDGPLAVAYSDTQKAALAHYEANGLEHHGVKGMRWGQRKTETVSVGGKSKQVTPKKAAKLDKKFEKQASTLGTYIKIHNGAADHFNSHIEGINKKYPMDLNKLENQAHRDAYHREVEGLMREGYKQSASNIKNPTGTRSIDIQFKENGVDFTIGTKKVAHAATNAQTGEQVFRFKVTRDTNGLITKIEPIPTQDPAQTAAHGEQFVNELIHGSVLDNPTLKDQITAKIKSILDDVTGDADGDVNLFGDPLIQTKIRSVLEDFYKDPNVDNAVVYSALGEALQHFGIKGMRWGIRKEDGSGGPHPVAPQATSHVPGGARRKTQVKVAGGENHPASQDAIKVAESHAKLRKSGMSALSNKELQDLQTRLNLEKNVSQLTGSKTRVGKGREFVKSLTRGGKEVNDAVNTGFQTARLAKAAR